MIIGKARAAVELFVRTAVASFLGSLALIQLANIDLDALKATLVAAGGAAVSAGVAAVWRSLQPLQTDSESVGVAGVSPPE
jgi:hypothetical protein